MRFSSQGGERVVFSQVFHFVAFCCVFFLSAWKSLYISSENFIQVFFCVAAAFIIAESVMFANLFMRLHVSFKWKTQ